MDAIHFAFLWTSSSLQFFEKKHPVFRFFGQHPVFFDSIQFSIYWKTSSFQFLENINFRFFWKTSSFQFLEFNDFFRFFFGKHRVFSSGQHRVDFGFWKQPVYSFSGQHIQFPGTFLYSIRFAFFGQQPVFKFFLTTFIFRFFWTASSCYCQALSLSHRAEVEDLSDVLLGSVNFFTQICKVVALTCHSWCIVLLSCHTYFSSYTISNPD